MSKVKVRNKDSKINVRIKTSRNEKINERQLDYFSQKNTKGFFKVTRIKHNSVRYAGPVGITLQERLRRTITKYDFLFIIEQIVDISQQLNKNSLILSSVLWDIRYAYINETTKELRFFYFPLEHSDYRLTVLDFLEQFVYAVIPADEPDTGYVTRFAYFLRSLTAFDDARVEKYVHDEDARVVEAIKRYEVHQSGFITDKPLAYYEHYAKNDDEETGLLSGCYEETGLLCEDDNDETGLL